MGVLAKSQFPALFNCLLALERAKTNEEVCGFVRRFEYCDIIKDTLAYRADFCFDINACFYFAHFLAVMLNNLFVKKFEVRKVSRKRGFIY